MSPCKLGSSSLSGVVWYSTTSLPTCSYQCLPDNLRLVVTDGEVSVCPTRGLTAKAVQCFCHLFVLALFGLVSRASLQQSIDVIKNKKERIWHFGEHAFASGFLEFLVLQTLICKISLYLSHSSSSKKIELVIILFDEPWQPLHIDWSLCLCIGMGWYCTARHVKSSWHRGFKYSILNLRLQ